MVRLSPLTTSFDWTPMRASRRKQAQYGTSLITAPLGSAAWIEQVRASPPVRDPLGRSRPTHQYKPYLDSLGRPVPCEGANEATCALLLDILAAAGLVRWWKEQPFKLTSSQHGLDATPDAMFEWFTGKHYVLETKSAKYVTEKVQAKASQLESLLSSVGLTYLFWTDDKQVGDPLRTTVRKVRNASGADITAEEVGRVVELVSQGAVTVRTVLEQGIRPDAYRHAIAIGKIHCNLTEKLDEHALLYPTPLQRAYDVLLGSGPDLESWWNALPDSQPRG